MYVANIEKTKPMGLPGHLSPEYLLCGVGRLFRHAGKWWIGRIRKRRTHQQLNRLNDRMLTDVGVKPSELPMATLAPTPHDALYMISLTTPRR